ncbi:MAG: Hsp20 family protein [Rikenellaceae bacterium]|nr:Hsp20 family protein [Rikenellaceae bacterium]
MDNKLRKYEGGRNYPSFFNRLFDDDFFSRFDNNLPAVNVKETDREYKLEVSAPGFDKDDFDVKIDKNVLTISASKENSKEQKDENEKVLRQEFTSSTFIRSFTIPEQVDTEHIEAEQKNGVLCITLPKREEAPEEAVKKIEIK